MAIDDQIKDKKLQCDIDREAAKTSALSSDKIDKYFRSTINKHNEELQHVSKELSQSETFLSKQLSTIDFYILNKSITYHNKKASKIAK